VSEGGLAWPVVGVPETRVPGTHLHVLELLTPIASAAGAEYHHAHRPAALLRRHSVESGQELLRVLKRLVWFGLLGCVVIAGLGLAGAADALRWSLSLAMGVVLASFWAIVAAARAHARSDAEGGAALAGLRNEQADRIEAEEAVRLRDEVLAMAAHELKNPATTLRGYAQLMARQLDQTGALDQRMARHALQAIDSQSARLDRLLTQVLDMSRLQSGKVEVARTWTDVSQLVGELVGATRLLHPTTHTLVLRTAPGLWAAVDTVRFEEVVTNLLENAIKYSPNGGEIEVELLRPDEHTLRLSVRDHGIGVSEEHRQRIFDRFYQVQSGGEVAGRGGVGLGLYICREIVSLHEGTIRAEAPADGGTRMVVELPIEAAEAEVTRATG
jgi:signal transduction histidine kinase